MRAVIFHMDSGIPAAATPESAIGKWSGKKAAFLLCEVAPMSNRPIQHTILAYICSIARAALKAGRRMRKSAVVVSLAVLASMSVAAHSQSSVIANPASDGAANPGTAPLDSLGIFAGAPTPIVVGQPFWVQQAFMQVNQVPDQWSMAVLRGRTH
jgi:hypothetical protein